MKVNIQSIHFDADKKLLAFVEERVGKLQQYFDGAIASDVSLKLDNAIDHENKIAEIKIQIPGSDLFASKCCKSFEEATDSAVDALKKQIVRHKEKLRGE